MRFTKEELSFIRKELGIEVLEYENREKVLDDIWEEACQIEIMESNSVKELTPRGRMAVQLVTKLGEV